MLPGQLMKSSAKPIKISSLVLLILLLSSLRASFAEPPDIHSIHISSSLRGEVQIFTRLSGKEDYRKSGSYELPATITLPDGKNYDVMIVKYENLLVRHRGEKKEVHSPLSITITTYKEFLWTRLLLIALLPILGLLEFSRRNKMKKSRDLASHLEVAEARVREVESKAEQTILEGHIPETIGSYIIQEKVGEGGMASVYRAKDSYGDIYALKVPHSRFMENEEFMKRFSHEAKMGKNLNSPNIVRIHDYNLDKSRGIPFICLEFLEGATLAELVKKKGVLEAAEAIHLIRKMAEGLAHAHAKGIVHRDIKPGNILITPGNDIKIMDFGVAKVADLSTVTVTDTALGTPRYMAPEQIDSKDVDARADLYALGIIFFELITGRLPFEDEDPYRIVMKKLTIKPSSPSDFKPSLSEDVENIILKLIKKEPGERYQAASELIADLKRIE